MLSRVMFGAYCGQDANSRSVTLFSIAFHPSRSKNRSGATNSSTPTRCFPSGARLGSQSVSVLLSAKNRLLWPRVKISAW